MGIAYQIREMYTHTKGAVVQSTGYYPFGLQTADSWTREDALGNSFLYNGGSELDDNTGNYQTFFREYDPALGRMTAIDPLAAKYSSWSPYNYAFNDPVALNDPTGAEPYFNHTYIMQFEHDVAGRVPGMGNDFGNLVGSENFSMFGNQGSIGRGTHGNNAALYGHVYMGSAGDWANGMNQIRDYAVMGSSAFASAYPEEAKKIAQARAIRSGIAQGLSSDGFGGTVNPLTGSFTAFEGDSYSDEQLKNAFIAGAVYNQLHGTFGQTLIMQVLREAGVQEIIRYDMASFKKNGMLLAHNGIGSQSGNCCGFKDISDPVNFPGVNIYEHPYMRGGITLPGIGIIVGPGGSKDKAFLQHEYGHYLDYKLTPGLNHSPVFPGIANFYLGIGLPSLLNTIPIINQIPGLSGSHRNYWTEIRANQWAEFWFGDALDPRFKDRFPTTNPK